MSRIQRSKSSTFLMELIFNLLLFCVLCSCGLLLFSKSYNLTKDTSALHQAVSLASSVASIYESGDGDLDCIQQIYPNSIISNQEICIYFSETFSPCSKENAAYYILASQEGSTLEVNFYNMQDALTYSITTSHHQPARLMDVKEAQNHD